MKSRISKDTPPSLIEDDFARLLFDQSVDPVVIADAQTGCILECNASAEKYFGYSREQLIGTHQKRLHPPEEYAGEYSRNFQEHHVDPSQPLETTLVTASGEIRSAIVRASFFERNGKRMIMGVFRDSQEIKIWEHEKRLRLLFEEMSAGFALHEIICNDAGKPVDYRFLDINPAFERLTGLQKTAVVGKTVREVLPDTEEEWIARYGNVALTGKSIEFESYSQEMDSWYEVKSYSPSPGRFAVLFSDITTRKRIERSFQTASEIIASIPAGLFVYKYIAPDNLFLEETNPEATRLTGILVPEWRGKEFDEIWPAAQAIGLKQKFLQPFSTGAAYTIDMVAYSDTRLAGRAYRVRTFLLPEQRLGVAFEDVTEKKKAEEELLRIFTMSQDIICIADLNTSSFVKVNPAVTRVLGFEEEELLGKAFEDFIHPDDIENTARVVEEKLQAGKEVLNFENRYRTKEGAYRLLKWEAYPVLEEGRMYAIARDITDERLAEEALNKRFIALTQPLDETSDIDFFDIFFLEDIQKIQDELARATGVASIITHPDGTPITRPSNFCRLCSEVIRTSEKGRSNCQLSDAVLGRQGDGPTIQKCLSGGLWDAGASISVGGKHIANWLVGQVRDKNQTEESMRAYARDIGVDEEELVGAFQEVPAMTQEKFAKIAQLLFTLAEQLSSIAYQNTQQARFIVELKQVREQLLESVEELNNTMSLLDAVIEQSPIPLLLVNAETKSFQVLNSACHSLLGIDEEQRPIGQSTVSFQRKWKVHSPDGELFSLDELPLQKALGGESTYEKEVRIVREDGSERLATLYGTPIFNRHKQIIAALVIMVDITEKKRTDAIMVQTEKMMSVGGLAAGMAHEINNPLAGILGAVQNLQNRLLRDMSKNERVASECGVSMEGIKAYSQERGVAKMLDTIHEAGARASTIVNNMLQFSRKSEQGAKYYDLAQLLDATVALAASDFDLKKEYDFRKIEIVREFAPDVPNAYCVASEVQQVFLNVFKNGAEAMAGKTYVKGGPRFILRVEKMQDMVGVVIEDNGPGMSEEAIKKVFDPFYTTKAVGKGTGLGLSVSYFIITELHKGTMEVTSEEGEFTRFYLRFPLVPAY